MLQRLKALGYREITLTADGLLGPAGTTARGHEFHYSEIAGETGNVPRLYHLTARQGGAAGAKATIATTSWPATCTSISAATRRWPGILVAIAGHIKKA